MSELYRTIVADPPWQYQKDTSDGCKPGTAERHYPTMSMRDIAALPVAPLAEDNAHLYLWVTNPRLDGDRHDHTFTPFDVVRAWGFEYKTMLTWAKDGAPGLGWYFRASTEHVLFAVRGRLPIPPESRERNLFHGPKARHSEKPANFMDMVERVSPGPYIELFARRQRLGWDTWGNECLTHVSLP